LTNKPLKKKLIAGFIVLYSLVVIASSTPRFGDISNVPVILYFIFLPGFSITLLLKEDYSLIGKGAYSIILSLAAVLTLLTIQQFASPLPFQIIIPSITIVITTCYYFFRTNDIKLV